jgi:chromosome segregation ATPase
MKSSDKDNINDLILRLDKLRQAIKSKSRSRTPTRPTSSKPNSKSQSRNVTPGKISNYKPLILHTPSKTSEKSVSSSGASYSYIPKSIVSRKSERSYDRTPKKSIENLAEDSERIKLDLSNEIEKKIEYSGQLEDRIEKFNYLLDIVRQERSLLDKNLALHNYVIKHTVKKSELETLSTEVDNLKSKLRNLKDQTAEIRSHEERMRLEIEKINGSIKDLKNENTIIKVRN